MVLDVGNIRQDDLQALAWFQKKFEVSCAMFFQPTARNLYSECPRSQIYNEYLAQTMLIVSYLEIQSRHHVGTWTLGVLKC